MHLLAYILDEPKEIIYRKVISKISLEEYDKLKSSLEECLKYDFIEIKIFSESISFEFYNNYTLLKTNTKYSNFLNNEGVFGKISQFETNLIPFLEKNTLVLRLDEYLIDKYNECFPHLNIFDEKKNFIDFMEWIKSEDFNHWKLIKEGDLSQ